MKKTLTIILTVCFLNSLIMPGYAYAGAVEYLCEIGMKYYNQGMYDDALHEFNKALLVKPGYKPVLRYIRMVEEVVVPPELPSPEPPIEERFLPVDFTPSSETSAGAMQEILDLLELQQEMIEYRRAIYPQAVNAALPVSLKEVVPGRKILPEVMYLDDSFVKITQPIEIAQGSSILIRTNNIRRFLLTQPEVLTVQRNSPDELLLTGKGIGYTYLHVWDDSGRRTMEFLGVYPKPESPTYEEILRRELEKKRNFKLRYSLSWSSYESGRRLDNLERTNYSWVHGIGLSGPTPYGHFNSQASIRSSDASSDANLTYLTISLLDGRWGPFKGFDMRAVDFSPNVSNLAMSRLGLRGVMFESPAFNNKFNYITFWGREGGGRFGDLSPDLLQTRHAFLEGVNLSYSPTEKQNYRFTVVHGHGRDRELHLNRYSYDLVSNWHIDNWHLGYEIAHDSESFAHLFNTRYTKPKLNLSAELRNIDKNYFTITEGTWRQGELGALFNLNYKPTEQLYITSRLDLYLDRLNPALDNNDRWNEDFDWSANYRLDPDTSLGFTYTFQNQLGRISQIRYQSPGLSVSKKLNFFKDIYSYLNYYHQENKNFSAPGSDYINERLYGGIQFELIGDVYYYLNGEYNWLTERQAAARSKPRAWETGLSWSNRFGQSPFYGNFRINYRNEEETTSGLSFLSGQDYIEGYSQLSYRPNPDAEIYGACRVRNIWADSPSVAKRIDVDFNAGMRYVWDTGISYESVGSIKGYVFKDLNSDGLRQRDEAPVEGIRIWLGKDKSQVTDLFGYYKFKNVRGRKAFVNLDTSSLPAGFVPTVPVTQGVNIEHSRMINVDFGMISRTEISGIVFEDADGNLKYNKGDTGLKNAAVTLEDGRKVLTDDAGRYSFRNIPYGDHTIILDLSSLPVYYIPQIAIKKEITLFEGVTYIYDIPLKKLEQKE
ncbi:MAG: pilus assembly protein N-terminal domain-containing protein [Candidatus Omnitrophota bacterium]